MKKLALIGNVGGNVEKRTVKTTGASFLSFSVAINSGSKEHPKTDWVNVTINNEKLMEIAEKFIVKGSKLYIEGYPSVDAYVNNEGQAVATQRLSASYFEILNLPKHESLDSAEAQADDSDEAHQLKE